MTAALDEATAAGLASVALGHVTREWPHGLAHAMAGPDDFGTPRAMHPVFFGSFDWHSCVHAYWMLATLLRRFPGMGNASDIVALFDARLTPAAVDGECAYFRRPVSRGFERPYGWAWLLALQHALRGTAWAPVLRPLADIVLARFRAFLPLATYPVRVGTHFNTAFALTIAHPFVSTADPALAALFRERALAWYGGDEACQAWEPSQDEFLSPALTEAACMARLHPGAFPAWFARFLPALAEGHPATLFTPAAVSDRTDGKIAHLDGLNLSRAWCWRLLAAALPHGDPRRPAMDAAAARHEAAGLGHVTGDFMGEHWLASFAVLTLWPGAIDGE